MKDPSSNFGMKTRKNNHPQQQIVSRNKYDNMEDFIKEESSSAEDNQVATEDEISSGRVRAAIRQKTVRDSKRCEE